jgi:GT2 family glycosyltransferase
LTAAADTEASTARCATVVAVVTTYNRREWLLACLDSLARQTRPPAAVVVVDNGSTDGTEDAIRTADVLDRLPVHYLRLPRNGGCAEGNHFGIRAALELGCDWVWLFDDDADAAPDALEQLLDSTAAQRPATVLLAPTVVTTETDEIQLLHRGTLRRRVLLTPMRPLPAAAYLDDVRLDFTSYLGVLVRASAIRAAGLPRREMFVWMDDVDFTERLAHVGELRLIPAARVRHREQRGRRGESLSERLRVYAKPLPFDGLWKNLYGLRNVISWGLRSGYVSRLAVGSYVVQHLARTVLFDPDKQRRARLILEFARQGVRGEAFNVDPAQWPVLDDVRDPVHWLHEHSLDHTEDYGAPVALTSAAAR